MFLPLIVNSWDSTPNIIKRSTPYSLTDIVLWFLFSNTPATWGKASHYKLDNLGWWSWYIKVLRKSIFHFLHYLKGLRSRHTHKSNKLLMQKIQILSAPELWTQWHSQALYWMFDSALFLCIRSRWYYYPHFIDAITEFTWKESMLWEWVMVLWSGSRAVLNYSLH